MRRRQVGLRTIGLCAFLVACGTDCVSLCKEAQADGDCFQKVDADGNFRDRDCAEYCKDVEEVADEDNGDCEEELDAVLSCTDDRDEGDTCNAFIEGCAKQRDDLALCIDDYCASHPSKSACRNLVGP